MLSKNKIKDITSLQQKKFREQTSSFVIEGDKMVQTLLEENFELSEIFALQDWISDHYKRINNHKCTINEVSELELSKISSLQTPNKVLAIAKIPHPELQISSLENQLCLVLDSIQDPGNMGTIIRLADWFGIHHIICSHGTVDAFNPKVVQSTMGALAKTKIYYTDLNDFLSLYKQKIAHPIYGTFLNGQIIYDSKLDNKGLIIMGNEGNGISESVASYVNQRLFIPSFGTGSESLNVAIAAAIVCSEFKRR